MSFLFWVFFLLLQRLNFNVVFVFLVCGCYCFHWVCLRGEVLDCECVCVYEMLLEVGICFSCLDCGSSRA